MGADRFQKWKDLVDRVMKISDRHLRRYINLRQRIEAQCDEWDGYSKGESQTTKALRDILNNS
jgi:hypothetical protein